MSSFRTIEHSFPAQHIREYPQAISTFQEDVLNISVKQYIPLNTACESDAVTIIAAHASAFPKELYEPLWEDLLSQSHKAGYSIRSIWMCDVANQGASYVLNESKTGIDPNFGDHARDLLAMINHFRSEFTRPIVGIGHSMGASALINLSHMHPRLLSSLVLIDPVIPFKANPSLWPMLRLSSHRKDYWKNRTEAEATFRKNSLVKRFDQRVVEKILMHSIRPTPTLLYPQATPDNKDEEQQQAYTLITPKHQEAASIARPNYEDVSVLSSPNVQDRYRYPDVWPDAPYKSPFYKSEGRAAWMFLPHLRPSVFWLYGADSYAADPEERQSKMERTRTGWNGSGGAPLGRVKEALVQGSGHFVCMEKVNDCAIEISGFLESEMEVWREGEKSSIDQDWGSKDVVERQKLDEKWLEEAKKWKGQRKVDSKL